MGKIGHLLSTPPKTRTSRLLSKYWDDSLKLLALVVVAAILAFLLPLPGLEAETQTEISQLACITSKTTNMTAKILGEMNQEMLEWRTAVFQNRAMLLKKNWGCKQFPGMCCFHISDFSHAIDNQINELQKEIDKICLLIFNALAWKAKLLFWDPC